jgi:dynein assembly factor 2
MDALEEEGNSQKKSVRFNDMVKRQVYDTKSRIQGQTAKNKKKAAKKKRAAERRVSEGDADGTSYDEKLQIRESRASSVGYDTGDSLGEDSGCASSFEENVILTGNITPSIIYNSNKKQDLPKKKKDKRRVKTFEMSSDLIFDLDI